MSRFPIHVVLPILAAAFVAGCEEVEELVDEHRDRTPWEAYASSLQQAELDGTALGRAWLRAASGAVENAAPVELPFREQGWFPPEAPSATGYRLTLRRGQVLTVAVDLEATAGELEALPAGEPAALDSTRLFVDLFRLPENPADPPRPVLRADSAGPGRFSYEPWREGAYVLRIQPELLRGGRYRLTLSLDPALAFPVDGRDVGAIQSFFGAARDGGAREHHGVDIFAPRGTPVLAATDGTVRRANETPRGGRVVWLRDERRSQSLYYAHLDSQAVSRNQRVRRGDTLGFVGNTGNARTTPPHLHFGIYQRGRGPVDPLAWLGPVRRPMPGLAGDADRLGRWVRTTVDGARVRVGPGPEADVSGELPGRTALRVLGGNEDWWRVRLPDGGSGYVAARVTQPTAPPAEAEDRKVADSPPEPPSVRGSPPRGPRRESPPAPPP